ncbi:MAG: hypothetical protein NC411_10630 [Bacteroides sp.]|nr:hypothetical protein [Bacteroides sp.]
MPQKRLGRQIPINLTSERVAVTILCGLHKAGVANILRYKSEIQHYTAAIHISDEKTDSNQ